MIRVQREAFDAAAELRNFRESQRQGGAIVMFLGTVRELGETGAIEAMTLEHYPEMTEKALAEIETEANRRWPLIGSMIIHRYGRLEPGEDIVLNHLVRKVLEKEISLLLVDVETKVADRTGLQALDHRPGLDDRAAARVACKLRSSPPVRLA
jgi:hypothetical protein